MEKIKFILDMISGFISNTLVWSVVVLIIAIIFRKALIKKIKKIKALSIFGVKLSFRDELKNIKNKINLKTKSKVQSTEKFVNSVNINNNPELAIPFIYSRIESAVREKFKIHNAYDILVSLAENKKIDTNTFIILDSMRSLRDNIHIYAKSQKISRNDIVNYEDNANRIIEIIKDIES